MKLRVIGKGYFPFPSLTEQKLINSVTYLPWFHVQIGRLLHSFRVRSEENKMAGVKRTRSRCATPLGDPRGIPKCIKFILLKFEDFLLGCLEGFGAGRIILLVTFKNSSFHSGIQFKMADSQELLLFPDLSVDELVSEVLKDIGVENFDFNDIDVPLTTPDSIQSTWSFNSFKNAQDNAAVNPQFCLDLNAQISVELYKDSEPLELTCDTKEPVQCRESDSDYQVTRTSELPKNSRGTKRKATYETMRRQNNDACKRYREKEKEKKQRLELELEELSTKNKLLCMKLDEVKSEVQRLQNQIIFQQLLPKRK